MKIFYINLNDAKDRRAEIERQFKKYHTQGDSLVRIPAIDPQDKLIRKRPGTARDSQKSVFLSHLTAIQQAGMEEEPSMVAEDDIKLLPDTIQTIKKIIPQLSEGKWDIIYTDVIITTLDLTNYFYRETRKNQQQRKLSLIPLHNKIYAGATGYIVNPISVKKILKIMSHSNIQNAPWDMTLRHHIHKRNIKAFVTVPFQTTVTEQANNSKNQLKDSIYTDILWNTIRKIITNPEEANQDHLIKDIQFLTAGLKKEEQMLGQLIACYLSEFFKPK